MPRWRRILWPSLLGVGTLFLLGGFFMAGFWILAALFADRSQIGMTDDEFRFAVSIMLLMSVLGLLAPAVIMLIVGWRLRRP